MSSFAYAIELNSSVMLFNQDDLDKCELQIQKAKNLKNSRINLVSSLYVELDGTEVTKYYIKNKQAHAKVANSNNIVKYQQGLIRCVEYALEEFQDVYVSILLNQIREDRLWRNFYDYDPLRKYSEFSLYEISFKPFEKISASKLKRVFLSLTGEMGRSIKLYPTSYQRILERLPKELNIGVSLNFNQSFGSFLDFNLKLPVLNDFDFIGFSGYEMVPSECSAEDFIENIKNFKSRIRGYGLTKPEAQWRLHINETGIGGGLPLAVAISKLPFKGVYGAYSQKKDPWRFESYRRIRKNFYQCLLTALKGNQQIKAAFIWNTDSLDVQGLYPFSKEYRDEEISQLIKTHNLSKN